MTPEDRAEYESALTGGDYHCPCGWSSVRLPWRTAAETRAAHEAANVHALATARPGISREDALQALAPGGEAF